MKGKSVFEGGQRQVIVGRHLSLCRDTFVYMNMVIVQKSGNLSPMRGIDYTKSEKRLNMQTEVYHVYDSKNL